MTTIYVAKYDYGEPRITSVELIKETPKQYKVSVRTRKDVLGQMYLGSTIPKRTHHVFPTLTEARQYCLEEARKHYAYLENSLSRTARYIEQLETEINKGDKHEV